MEHPLAPVAKDPQYHLTSFNLISSGDKGALLESGWIPEPANSRPCYWPRGEILENA